VKKFAKYTLVFLVFAVAIFLLGPRPATDETIHFDVSNVGSDLDTYLSEDEKGIANLTPGAEKAALGFLDAILIRQSRLRNKALCHPFR